MSKNRTTRSPTPISMFTNSSFDLRSNTLSESENGTIFYRKMTVYLWSNDSLSFNSQSTMQLVVQVTSRLHELRKAIDIQIHDPNNPFFVYTYLIDSVEFDNIRQSQQLLISFESFPQIIKNLLEKCSNSHDDNCISTSSNKLSFMLCIRDNNQIKLKLDIIEPNEIRHIVHLSLVIPAANEEFIRTRYVEVHRKLVRENEHLSTKIDNIERDMNNLRLSKSQDEQRCEDELTHQKHEYEDRIRNLERENRAEKEILIRNERNLKSKITKLEIDVESISEKFDKERQEFEQKCTDIKEMFTQEFEQKCTDIKEMFTQELEKKNFRIKDLEEKNNQLSSEHDYQREFREKCCKQMKLVESDLESTKKDLTKANEIIRKLQEEVTSSREKLGILNQVTHKQEKIVGIKESTVEQLGADLKLCLQQLKWREKEIDRLETELERYKTKYSQSELQIKANKMVIAKLNKQLDLHEMQPVPQQEKTIPTNGDAVPDNRKSQPFTKNVEFCLDQPRKTKCKTLLPRDDIERDSNEIVEQYDSQKNDLFLHIKPKTKLKEVNVKTNHKLTSNVIPSTRRNRIL